MLDSVAVASGIGRGAAVAEELTPTVGLGIGTREGEGEGAETSGVTGETVRVAVGEGIAQDTTTRRNAPSDITTAIPAKLDVLFEVDRFIAVSESSF